VYYEHTWIIKFSAQFITFKQVDGDVNIIKKSYVIFYNGWHYSDEKKVSCFLLKEFCVSISWALTGISKLDWKTDLLYFHKLEI
jgi:hypothetical protein